MHTSTQTHPREDFWLSIGQGPGGGGRVVPDIQPHLYTCSSYANTPSPSPSIYTLRYSVSSGCLPDGLDFRILYFSMKTFHCESHQLVNLPWGVDISQKILDLSILNECVQNVRMCQIKYSKEKFSEYFLLPGDCCHVLLGPPLLLFNHSVRRTVSWKEFQLDLFNCSSDGICCKLRWDITQQAARMQLAKQPSLLCLSFSCAVSE